MKETNKITKNQQLEFDTIVEMVAEFKKHEAFMLEWYQSGFKGLYDMDNPSPEVMYQCMNRAINITLTIKFPKKYFWDDNKENDKKLKMRRRLVGCVVGMITVLIFNFQK
jgi:hypothetical protein